MSRASILRVVILTTIISSTLLLLNAQSDYMTENASKSKSVMITRHSLVKPYYTSSLRDWKFLRSAYLTNSHIVLTRDERSRQGAVWNLQQVLFPYWEVEIEFQVTGSGSDLYGDGLVFWYAKEAMIDGPVFGYKDYFHGLGVFMDTYNNHNGEHSHEHPYISVMINDGTKHYDHDRDGTHTQLSGCTFFFRSSTDTAFVKIRYLDDRLTVLKRMSTEQDYSTCIEADGVRLPTKYYMGVTAATGDLSDEHRLISFKTYALSATKALNEDRSSIVPFAAGSEKERDHVDDVRPLWFLKAFKYLFYLMLLISIFAILAWAFVRFNRTRELQRKRFY
ncbi:hypothetical protein ACOME3_010218 [Neoechinorhynchus agilis]